MPGRKQLAVSLPCPGYDDICVLSAWGDILIKGWLDLLSILLNHAGDIPPSYSNIALDAAEHSMQFDTEACVGSCTLHIDASLYGVHRCSRIPVYIFLSNTIARQGLLIPTVWLV